MSICALCGLDRPLLESHIIPSFVFDRIKKNSPTGFLRGAFQDPNMRKQDGDKQKLLCEDCEQRFSKVEKKFAEEIFEPYHETGQTSFDYGDWLSYFICSVNWRTLHLDNVGFHAEKKWGNDALVILDTAEKTLADFLLGKRSDISHIENHVLPMFEITEKSSDLKEPNFMFRISAFGYTLFIPSEAAYYVFANLAGVLIVTIIGKHKSEIWENTIVELRGGSMSQPPVHVSSPLMFDIIERIIQSVSTEISQKQIEKIIQTHDKNPDAGNAKAVQYRKMDHI